MTPIRRRLALVGLVTVAWVGLLAQPAAALHKGATADCGDAGTFTVRAQENGAGFESPPPSGAFLFEEGGVLTLLRIVRDGVVTFDAPATGRAKNAVDEVTCVMTLANGSVLEITGVLGG
jgi:hypothetical protein